jgi:hypothetical protein
VLPDSIKQLPLPGSAFSPKGLYDIGFVRHQAEHTWHASLAGSGLLNTAKAFQLDEPSRRVNVGANLRT